MRAKTACASTRIASSSLGMRWSCSPEVSPPKPKPWSLCQVRRQHPKTFQLELSSS
jgi:hypothetical protein